MADKVKRNQFTLLLEKNVCQDLKLLKLGCELKFISLQHKLSCKCFNDIENKWTQKILVLALPFSKLLNHNYRPKETSLSQNLLKNKTELNILLTKSKRRVKKDQCY